MPISQLRQIAFTSILLGLPFMSYAGSVSPQRASEDSFSSAAREFDVPTPLLEAIAYVESRWTQTIPTHQDGHQRAYGVMGLRDDDWFGHSLSEAARLIGRSPEDLIFDARQNIRGGAAYLRKLAGPKGLRGGSKSIAALLTAWQPVVAEYSGIPDPKDAQTYVHDVYAVLRKGKDSAHIFIPAFEVNVPSDQTSESDPEPDYPGAVWDPSPNIDSREGILPQFVVIHTTQGNFAGAVSWLKNPISRVSAHYVIRSSDGFIKQLVREGDRAWHARCWNRHTIGIEHEGFVETPDFYTEALYQASAGLGRHLSQRYGITVDLLHVFGHDFWSKPEFPSSPIAEAAGTCNDHTDPGQYWDWTYYLNLLNLAKAY